MSNTQIQKYKYKIHKYTNTAYDKLLERPNMWHMWHMWPMAMTNVRRKKTTPEGYARADTLDNQKLRKYAKALAKEAELYRNARKE